MPEQVMDALAGGDWMSQREILAALPDGARHDSLRGAIQGLVKSGRVEARGSTKDRRYRHQPGVRTPAQQPAERKASPSHTDDPDGRSSAEQQPTQEGRVMSLLQWQHLSVERIQQETGIQMARLREILSKLMREGDVRLKKGNPPEYYAVT